MIVSCTQSIKRYLFLVQEVKVKLPFNKSWEKNVDFVNSNFLFTGLIFVDLVFNILKYLGPYQASMMQRLAKIVNSF